MPASKPGTTMAAYSVELVVDLPAGGTYYLRIHGANAGNQYNLWWDDLTSDDAYEQNDSKAEADAATPGVLNSPNLGTVGEITTIDGSAPTFEFPQKKEVTLAELAQELGQIRRGEVTAVNVNFYVPARHLGLANSGARATVIGNITRGPLTINGKPAAKSGRTQVSPRCRPGGSRILRPRNRSLI